LSTSVHSGGAASQYNTSGKTSAAAAANSQFIEETQQQQQVSLTMCVRSTFQQRKSFNFNKRAAYGHDATCDNFFNFM